MTHQEPKYVPEPEDQPDPWHQHTSDEPPPQEEHAARANPVALGVVMGAMVAFVLLSCILVVVYFNRYLTQERRVKQETRAFYHEYAEYREAQLAEMRGYAWLSEEDNTVRLDIDRAMELVVEEYNGK